MNTISDLPRPVVKLTGTDGNAFAIMGLMRRSLKGAGWNSGQIDQFLQECMSGDYDHLLATCLKYADVR